MADEKRYIDLPGLQDYDKGVKDALSKLSTRLDNLAEKKHEHYTSDVKDVNTGFYLDELLDNKSNKDHTHEIKDIKDFFIGSYEEYEAANNAGSIPVGAFVVITDDEEDEASSPILGVGQLDSMILG